MFANYASYHCILLLALTPWVQSLPPGQLMVVSRRLVNRADAIPTITLKPPPQSVLSEVASVTAAPDGVSGGIKTSTDGSETLMFGKEDVAKINSAFFLDRDGDSTPEVAEVIEGSNALVIRAQPETDDTTLERRVGPAIFGALAVLGAAMIIGYYMRLYNSDQYMPVPLDKEIVSSASEVASSSTLALAFEDGHIATYTFSNGHVTAPTGTLPPPPAHLGVEIDDGMFRVDLPKKISDVISDPAKIPETCKQQFIIANSDNKPMMGCVIEWTQSILANPTVGLVREILGSLLDFTDGTKGLYYLETLIFITFTGIWHLVDMLVLVTEQTTMSLVERILHGLLSVVLFGSLYFSGARGGEMTLADYVQIIAANGAVQVAWQRYLLFSSLPPGIPDLQKPPGNPKASAPYPDKYFGPLDIDFRLLVAANTGPVLLWKLYLGGTNTELNNQWVWADPGWNKLPSNVGDLDFFWCPSDNLDLFQIKYQGQQFKGPDGKLGVDNIWHWTVDSKAGNKFSCNDVSVPTGTGSTEKRQVRCSLRNQPSADNGKFRIQFEHRIYKPKDKKAYLKMWFKVFTEDLKEVIFSDTGYDKGNGQFDLWFPAESSPDKEKWYVPLQEAKGHIRVTISDGWDPKKAKYLIAHPEGFHLFVSNDGDGCEGLGVKDWPPCPDDQTDGCVQRISSCWFWDKGGNEPTPP